MALILTPAMRLSVGACGIGKGTDGAVRDDFIKFALFSEGQAVVAAQKAIDVTDAATEIRYRGGERYGQAYDRGIRLGGKGHRENDRGI